MSGNVVRALRMTIDVAVFPGDARTDRIVAVLKQEGKGDLGVGERYAREFMESIKRGQVEIDEVRSVEDHTA